MSIFSAVVLYATIWFLTALIMIHVGLRTQREAGEVVPGTPEGAPADFRPGRLILRTTIWAGVVWLLVAAIILYSGLSIRDIDFFGRMSKHTLD